MFKWKWLLITPFAIIVYYTLNYWLDENKCTSIISFFLSLILVFLLIITFSISLFAVFPKMEIEKRKMDRVAATIVGLISLTFGVMMFFDDNFKGAVWLEGESETEYNTNLLQLRKNGKATILISKTDISCQTTGHYSLNKDTVIFDRQLTSIYDAQISERYVLKDNLLFPVGENLKEPWVFRITKHY